MIILCTMVQYKVLPYDLVLIPHGKELVDFIFSIFVTWNLIGFGDHTDFGLECDA